MRLHFATWLAAVMYLLLASQIAHAATITVGAGGCTLDDAIRAANADAPRGNCPAGSGADTIRLPNGVAQVPGSPLAVINSPMTLRPVDGTTLTAISGSDTRRVLEIRNTVGVTLQRIAIVGGQVGGAGSTGGAGLLIENASVTLNGVEVSGNRVTGGNRRGAGLLAINANLTVNDSRFKLNLAETSLVQTSEGGNIALIDSTASIDQTTLQGFEFEDADFFFLTNNGADRGAGIYASGSQLTISNSLFTKHRASSTTVRDGLDLYLDDGSTATVSNSTFFHDFQENGSRIFTDNSTLVLNNSTIWADISEYGIESRSSTIRARNSLFVGYGFAFCRGVNDQGETIGFSLATNDTNLFPLDDDSCGVGVGTIEPPIQIDSPADNGGPTLTARLRSNIPNPAINAGNNATCTSTDQRGVSRGSDCDIGAYEANDLTDLAISMTPVTPAPYYSTQVIEYDVLVSNNGPGDAYGVDVSFNLSGVSVSGYQTPHNCAALACEIAALPSGGSTLIKLFVLKNGTPTFDATATVNNITDFSTDPNTGNNIDDTGNGGSIVLAADLQVTQRLLTAGPYFNGQALAYEVEIENLGPGAANSIKLSHNLTNLTPVSYAGCTSATAVLCNVIFLSSGATATITFNATVSGNPIVAEALVEATVFDPDSRNNSAETKNNTATDADIKLQVASISSPPFYPDQVVQQRITVVNSGPDDATNVEVESVTENLVLIGGDSDCMFFPCTLPLLKTGQEVEIDVTGIFSFPGPASHTVTASADQNDPDLSNNIDSIGGTVSPAADVEVEVSLNQSPPFLVGNTLVFDVIVKNNGAATAAAVQISSINQLALEILQVSSARCVTLPCTLNPLEIGTGNQEVMEVRARIIAPGTFRLQIQADAATHDNIEFNNVDSVLGSSTAPPVQEEIFLHNYE